MIEMTIGTPLGPLCFSEQDGKIVRAAFADSFGEAQGAPSPVLLEAERQVKAYFGRRLKSFDLPLAMYGTAFEQAVWAQLCAIPYGETRSYGEIAALLGCPGAARAVGRACGKNPLLLLVPCHRVLGAKGRLTGYAAGIERKRALLALEQAEK